MLTLFKPWRNGRDLKSSDEDWNNAFSHHDFSKRHLEIMRNMNIRYECLDARDDFYAELKSGAITFPGNGVTTSDIEEMQQRDQFKGDEGGDTADFGIQDIDDIPGKKELRRRADMANMTADMAHLGWD
ncbi:hypothetical protein LshimejAT787_2100600 [Lyophyllum shimeji]|uniref:Uncharacterized protein n=1 Tax=Lyophyllum shimeji TaxID=47721 RepID=A0A9P3PYA7_LYOSH|nr:hypothetical protein LshimejAT787_2100600 [Lyophyllum shimeji]